MPFVREFNTLLYDSNNNVLFIDLNNGITFSLYDINRSLISRKQIDKYETSFVTSHFDIDSNDNIYGLVSSEAGTLKYICLINNYLIKKIIFKYNPYENAIKFPYIKNVYGYTNIFYYLLNNQTPHTCSLIHKYRKNDKWVESTIDYINYDVLTNFKVINTPSHIIIFYYNIFHTCEELFMKCFSLKDNIWSEPYQITFSQKSKMYLSVIKDINDCYHITYAENKSGQYHCCYINGYTNFQTFSSKISKVFSDCITCTFPTVLYYNHILYIQWTEYNVLNFISSNDNGQTWDHTKIDTVSINNNFSCCRLGTNVKKNNNNIIYSFFNQQGFINILGIR